MSKSIFIAVTAGLVGLMVFVISQFSNVSVDKKGKVQVGVNEAEAGCFQDGPNCLPPLTFTDIEGKEWTPEMLRGKVVVVNFWATWCKPCQFEVPDLATVYRKYKDRDLVLLGLMTDDPSSAKLDRFVAQYGLNYPIIRVDQEISEAFAHPRALPTNFVYDRTGHLRFDRPGAISAGELEREIKELL